MPQQATDQTEPGLTCRRCAPEGRHGQGCCSCCACAPPLGYAPACPQNSVSASPQGCLVRTGGEGLAAAQEPGWLPAPLAQSAHSACLLLLLGRQAPHRPLPCWCCWALPPACQGSLAVLSSSGWTPSAWETAGLAVPQPRPAAHQQPCSAWGWQQLLRQACCQAWLQTSPQP